MTNLIYTEFSFSLPKGFIDSEGNFHKKGKIRSATGEDEIVVSKNNRVRLEPSYNMFVILSRLITSLGTLSEVTPDELENLFLIDFYYLQNLYTQINQYPRGMMSLGEFLATPWNSFIRR